MFGFRMKTQQYKESTIINKRIGKEKLRRKFESNEIDGQTVYFNWRRNKKEKFNFIENSMFGYIEVILFTELIFSGVFSPSPFVERKRYFFFSSF
jgi:hypothetical protein